MGVLKEESCEPDCTNNCTKTQLCSVIRVRLGHFLWTLIFSGLLSAALGLLCLEKLWTDSITFC